MVQLIMEMGLMGIHIEVIPYSIAHFLFMLDDMRKVDSSYQNYEENFEIYRSIYFISSMDIQNGEHRHHSESYKYMPMKKSKLPVMMFSGFYAMKIPVVSHHCSMNLDTVVE